jgi:hypothetical protein
MAQCARARWVVGSAAGGQKQEKKSGSFLKKGGARPAGTKKLLSFRWLA